MGPEYGSERILGVRALPKVFEKPCCALGEKTGKRPQTRDYRVVSGFSFVAVAAGVTEGGKRRRREASGAVIVEQGGMGVLAVRTVRDSC